MITPLEFALYAVIGVLVSIIIIQYVGKQEIIEQMDKEIKYWHEMYEQKNDEDKLLFKDGVLQDGIFKNFQDSPVSKDILVKDICIYAPCDLNKVGKEGKTSWDSFSYVLMMAHNVYNQIRAIQIANDLNDIESLKHRPEVKHWRKTKASDKTDEPSIYVPRNILYFNTFVEEVFTSEKPMDVISGASSYLADIRGNRWARATGGGKGTNNFSSLFE